MTLNGCCRGAPGVPVRSACHLVSSGWCDMPSILLTLTKAARRKELICIEGAMLRYYEGPKKIVIHEIVSMRPGAGQELLARLRNRYPTLPIEVRVPEDWPANTWFEKRGFVRIGSGMSPKGYNIVIWRLYT